MTMMSNPIPSVRLMKIPSSDISDTSEFGCGTISVSGIEITNITDGFYHITAILCR
jgi:hypothetical protein